MEDESKVPLDASLAETVADQLYKPCGCGEQFPRAWATFTIDMSLLSSEQREKVYRAQSLLREAKVGFDSGSGFGGRDWELDWSLTGARLSVRPIRCMHHDCSKLITKGKALWVVFRRKSDGWTPSYSYCSERCKNHDFATFRQECDILYTAWQEVGLKGDPWYAPLKRLWKRIAPKKKREYQTKDDSCGITKSLNEET